MKKLTKLKLNTPNTEELTINELSQLMGGVYDGDRYGPDDIVNTNSEYDCNCTYKNKTRAIFNENSITGCSCTCVK